MSKTDPKGCKMCPAGEKEVDGTCTSCEDNKYSLRGSRECHFCKAGYQIMGENLAT